MRTLFAVLTLLAAPLAAQAQLVTSTTSTFSTQTVTQEAAPAPVLVQPAAVLVQPLVVAQPFAAGCSSGYATNASFLGHGFGYRSSFGYGGLAPAFGFRTGFAGHGVSGFGFRSVGAFGMPVGFAGTNVALGGRRGVAVAAVPGQQVDVRRGILGATRVRVR